MRTLWPYFLCQQILLCFAVAVQNKQLKFLSFLIFIQISMAENGPKMDFKKLPDIAVMPSADNLNREQVEVLTGWVAQAHNPMNTSSFLKKNPECRICLQEALQDSPLIVPCRCIGSMKFMHETCYQEWLKHKLSGEANMQLLVETGLLCEICKAPLQTEIVFRTECSSRKRIGLKLCADKIKVMISILMLLVSTIVWVAGAVILIAFSKISGGLKFSDPITIIPICALVIGAVFFLLLLASFIRRYFITIRWTIVRKTKLKADIGLK